LAVVAHRRSETNEALARAAGSLGVRAAVMSPRDALRTLQRGDVALGRLDVRRSLDGFEKGSTELERLAESGVEVVNPVGALAAGHDRLLPAGLLRRAAVPHPRTWLIADGSPRPAPELPLALKPRFGSWGRDVVRCTTRDELDTTVAQLSHRPWFAEHG